LVQLAEEGAIEPWDIDIVREWVAVRARELIDDGEPLPDAIEQAWDEAGDDCGW